MSTKLRGTRPSRRFFAISVAIGAFALCAAAFAVEPAAYEECIRGDGASRIDTDYKPTKDARVVMEVEFDEYSQLSQPMALFCCRGNDVKKDTFTFLKLYTSPAAHWRFDYAQAAGTQSSASVEHNVRYKIEVSKAGAFVNGEKVGEGGDVSFTPADNLMLFASYRGGLASNLADYGTFRLYSCQIYDTAEGVANTLVCDLKPAVDENGAYGLYDAQRDRFLSNAGTGSFRGPKEVSVDSVSALTAALADARVGDVISVAPGTYKIEETLTINYGVTVEAQGGRGKVFFEPGETVVRQFVVDGGKLIDVTFQNFVSAPTLVRVQNNGFLIGCSILNNSHSGNETYGRGIVNCENGTVSRCVFKGNVGGGSTSSALSSTGTCRCENSLFYGNKAGYGGAINMHAGNWTVRNCTLIGNTCGTMGPQFYNGSRSPEFYNCLFLDSAVPHGYRNELSPGPYGVKITTGGKPKYYNCLVVGSANPDYWNYTTMANCVDIPYPGFVSTADNDFHLLEDSPMIGAGRAVTFSDSANCDLDGTPHPATPSIGCYEYSASYVPTHRTIFVATDGDDSDGSSWAKAYRDPVKALSLAPNGADVLVAAGDYAIERTLQVTNAVRLIGVSGRDATTIRAAAKGYRIVRIANAKSLVKGFTLADGDTTKVSDAGIFYNAAGGVIGISYVGGELTDCRITRCSDMTSGVFGHYAAVILADGGRIERCIVENNSAKDCIADLMGTQTSSGYVQVDDCLFRDNTVSSGGCVVRLRTETAWNSYTRKAAPVALRNCTVVHNGSVRAVSRQLDGGSVQNCVILNDSEALCPWSDLSDSHATNATDTAWRNIATTMSPVGTNCVCGVDLKVRSNGRPYFSSPCKEAGFIHLFATGPYAADVNGNPRIIEKDGEEVIDIGCYQLGAYGPGLMLLVR